MKNILNGMYLRCIIILDVKNTIFLNTCPRFYLEPYWNTLRDWPWGRRDWTSFLGIHPIFSQNCHISALDHPSYWKQGDKAIPPSNLASPTALSSLFFGTPLDGPMRSALAQCLNRFRRDNSWQIAPVLRMFIGGNEWT